MFIKAKKRGCDRLGSGEFGSSRGNRTHRGLDLCADPGDLVCSHVSGIVSKIGRPYSIDESSKKSRLKTQLRYVEIKDTENLKHRFFYVNPCVSIGDLIGPGSCIGKASDLNKIWKRMKNHIHYEVKTPGGEYLNPNRFL